MRTPAFGHQDSLLVAPIPHRPPATSRGTLRSWIPIAKESWSGFKRTTWSTITALTLTDFLRACHRSAMALPKFELFLIYYSFIVTFLGQYSFLLYVICIHSPPLNVERIIYWIIYVEVWIFLINFIFYWEYIVRVYFGLILLRG